MRGHNAAHGNDGQQTVAFFADIFHGGQRLLVKRSAAQAAFHSLQTFSRSLEPFAAVGGVGGHNAVDAVYQADVYYLVQLLIGEVRGDLEQHWTAVFAVAPHLVHALDNLLQHGSILQILQSLHVGAGDIQHKEIHKIVEQSQRTAVVLIGQIVLSVGVLGDVGTYYNIGTVGLEILQGIAHAIVVDAHVVDEGLVLWQAPKAGSGVALLRQRRQGADFHKTEAQIGQVVIILAVLVRIGEIDAE